MASSWDAANENKMKMRKAHVPRIAMYCALTHGQNTHRAEARRLEQSNAAGDSICNGIEEYGNAANARTVSQSAVDKSDAMPNNADAIGRPEIPTKAQARPIAHTMGNKGAHAIFARGPMTGRMLKTEQAYSWDSAFAANVMDKAPDKSGMRTKGNCSNQYVNSGAKTTIPAVDNADKANEVETEDVGDAKTMAKIPIPNAFRAEGRRCPKIENMPIEVMTVARSADMGAPENTRYEAIVAASTETDARFPTRSDFKTTAMSPVTMTRCAPETATRCATPHL